MPRVFLEAKIALTDVAPPTDPWHKREAAHQHGLREIAAREKLAVMRHLTPEQMISAIAKKYSEG
jgi:hypothetical protein